MVADDARDGFRLLGCDQVCPTDLSLVPGISMDLRKGVCAHLGPVSLTQGAGQFASLSISVLVTTPFTSLPAAYLEVHKCNLLPDLFPILGRR